MIYKGTILNSEVKSNFKMMMMMMNDNVEEWKFIVFTHNWRADVLNTLNSPWLGIIKI